MRVAARVSFSGSDANTAAARVSFTFGAYFMLARNVTSPGPAFSSVETPVIGMEGSPVNSQPIRDARTPRATENIRGSISKTDGKAILPPGRASRGTHLSSNRTPGLLFDVETASIPRQTFRKLGRDEGPRRAEATLCP